jgi:RNA recognition motif-containing protein
LGHFGKSVDVEQEACSVNIYMGNLPSSATGDNLQTPFAEFGDVQSSKVILDRRTNQSTGFGFVEKPGNSEADQAVKALNGTMIDGRTIKVNSADSRRKREEPVPLNDVYVDGSLVGEIGDRVVRDRERLSQNGFVLCYAPVDRQRRLAGEVRLVSQGVMQMDASEGLMEKARRSVKRALKKNGCRQQDSIRKTVQGFFTTRRAPARSFCRTSSVFEDKGGAPAVQSCDGRRIAGVRQREVSLNPLRGYRFRTRLRPPPLSRLSSPVDAAVSFRASHVASYPSRAS